MKRAIMKCGREHPQLPVRLVCLTAAIVFLVISAQAQTDATMPPIGGQGGNSFVARCPRDRFLTGFELRVGADVDAIKPICVAAYGPTDIGPFQFYPSKFGGDGGHVQQLVCPRETPVLIQMVVFWEGLELLTVNNLHLYCGVVGPTQTLKDIPSASFDGEIETGHKDISGLPITPPKNGGDSETCPPGLVAVGINGRAGQLLDAVGLICGPPKLTPRPVALGGIQPTAPAGPPMSICARARAARARNSPTAAALEAQCRAAGAAGEKAPPGPVALGTVQPTSPPGPPMSICARARAARARNSPTAPALEAQCRAAGAAGETVPTAGPAITASPNPVVVPKGQASGTTTISWKAAPDYTYSEIYLSVDNGEWSEFARGGDGAKSSTLQLGSSYTFRMMVYEGQAGTPKIIATLTLTAVKN